MAQSSKTCKLPKPSKTASPAASCGPRCELAQTLGFAVLLVFLRQAACNTCYNRHQTEVIIAMGGISLNLGEALPAGPSIIRTCCDTGRVGTDARSCPGLPYCITNATSHSFTQRLRSLLVCSEVGCKIMHLPPSSHQCNLGSPARNSYEGVSVVGLTFPIAPCSDRNRSARRGWHCDQQPDARQLVRMVSLLHDPGAVTPSNLSCSFSCMLCCPCHTMMFMFPCMSATPSCC
jgi:hypothetical protein